MARAGETDLTRLLVMQRGGIRGCDPNQIVRQQYRPQFAAHHLGRLTSNMIQMKIGLDRPDIKLQIPTKIVERFDLFSAVNYGIIREILMSAFITARPPNV